MKKHLSPSKLLLAGSGCESTAHTIELSRAMAEAGADCLLVVTPCYFKSKMDGRALSAHYAAVADASPVPVVLYNVPANTGVELGADAVAGLAAHPNIIGMKESNGDVTKIGLLIRQNQDRDFQVQ